MANLRGGSWEKQAKDAFHRVNRLAEGNRHENRDTMTRSDSVARARDAHLLDFVQHLRDLGIEGGKLNQYMGDQEIVGSYLMARTEGLAAASAVNVVSSFSSMIDALQAANVTIEGGGNEAIRAVRESLRPAAAKDRADHATGRAFDRADQIVGKLYERDPGAGLLADIQHSLGLRISEARELATHPGDYIRGGEVVGLVGKGRHEYAPKEISPHLAARIKEIDGRLPSDKAYTQHIRDVTGKAEARPHDFRVTYARDQMQQRIENGTPYREALREVSRELNHHRESMTRYYLARA